jgi:hypothetical protein
MDDGVVVKSLVAAISEIAKTSGYNVVTNKPVQDNDIQISVDYTIKMMGAYRGALANIRLITKGLTDANQVLLVIYPNVHNGIRAEARGSNKKGYRLESKKAILDFTTKQLRDLNKV